jgi:hypothetical protein
MPIYVPGKVVLAQTYVGIDDPDAAAYITAVEVADTAAGQSGGLETATKVAIHSFVKGCKADGIWPAIKASCILAGARTLTGALVPLVGTAPTNFNFVSGDYNRKTGLVGDGSTKYLDSNRANNADPQNNFHLAGFVSVAASAAGTIMGSGGNVTGASAIVYSTTVGWRFRSRASVISGSLGSAATIGFVGSSRSQGAEYAARAGATNLTVATASQSPRTPNIFVFDSEGLANLYNGSIAFYSIGESLNLALLDARVTDLINAFAAAIP